MTFHTHRTPRPAAVPPAARGLPGPVTRALRRLSRTVAVPSHGPDLADALVSLRAALPAFDTNPEILTLRRALADRITADLAALDAMGGDPDLTADFTVGRRRPDGTFATVGLASDDEGSLCGVGTHLWGDARGNTPYDAGQDLEADEADGPEGDDEREEEDEHGGDIQDEPHDPEEDANEAEIGMSVGTFDGVNYARPRRQRQAGFRPNGLRVIGPDGDDYLVSAAIR